jgi:hypothetical protein
VYLDVTEYVSTEPGSAELMEVNAICVFDFNEDGLIERNDIYWKQPQVDWFYRATISEAAGS